MYIHGLSERYAKGVYRAIWKAVPKLPKPNFFPNFQKREVKKFLHQNTNKFQPFSTFTRAIVIIFMKNVLLKYLIDMFEVISHIQLH